MFQLKCLWFECFNVPNNQKRQTDSFEFFSTSKTSLNCCLSTLFQNQFPLIFLLLLFKEYLDAQFRVNKMANEHTVDCHPSTSRLSSRIHPLIFLFLSYIPLWYGKIFKLMVFRLLENLRITILKVDIVNHAPLPSFHWFKYIFRWERTNV